jgi:glycosyltransferase involved in cell wall biosynthesis
MKILMILPELEEGGVERHVLWLSTELSTLGHTVSIVTAGGRLEEKLPPEVRVVHLPVHRKNPFTAFFSAVRIARIARLEAFDLLHAHSRVPAWIAWWASCFSGKPWIVTAHDRYRKNAAIGPFRKADGAICVSEAVRSHLEGFLPVNTVAIRNGIPGPSARWQKREEPGPFRFLFVGRLTRRKGLHVALSALSSVKGNPWVLDILGDGPQREELEAMSVNLGLEEKVFFHGFRDDVGIWMASADCLLFPSFDEGMPLTLMQGIRTGVPVLASGIDPVRELVGEEADLIPPGEAKSWERALSKVASRECEAPVYNPALVPSIAEMAARVDIFLKTIVGGGKEKTV